MEAESILAVRTAAWPVVSGPGLPRVVAESRLELRAGSGLERDGSGPARVMGCGAKEEAGLERLALETCAASHSIESGRCTTFSFPFVLDCAIIVN